MMWNNAGNCFGGFGGGFPMMMGGGLLMILFWGLIIWLIIYAVGKWTPNNNRSTASDDAVAALRQRYSQGEISTEEYRERLQELMKPIKKN